MAVPSLMQSVKKGLNSASDTHLHQSSLFVFIHVHQQFYQLLMIPGVLSRDIHIFAAKWLVEWTGVVQNWHLEGKLCSWDKVLRCLE
jgi:hypothetical protein